MVLGELSDLPAPALALVALFSLERFVELGISRARLAAAAARGREAPRRTAGGPLHWTAMVVLHAALLALPPIEALALGTRAPGWLLGISIAAALAAQALRYWCIVSLGPAWNARALVDPACPIVARGPYRWIRHPNYLAVLIEFAALPAAFGAWRTGLVLNLLHAPLIAHRIRAEERLLGEIEGYASAMGSKGRFLPRRAGARSVRGVS